MLGIREVMRGYFQILRQKEVKGGWWSGGKDYVLEFMRWFADNSV